MRQEKVSDVLFTTSDFATCIREIFSFARKMLFGRFYELSRISSHLQLKSNLRKKKSFEMLTCKHFIIISLKYRHQKITILKPLWIWFLWPDVSKCNVKYFIVKIRVSSVVEMHFL